MNHYYYFFATYVLAGFRQSAGSGCPSVSLRRDHLEYAAGLRKPPWRLRDATTPSEHNEGWWIGSLPGL